jgi:hypothetical protein
MGVLWPLSDEEADLIVAHRGDPEWQRFLNGEGYAMKLHGYLFAARGLSAVRMRTFCLDALRRHWGSYFAFGLRDDLPNFEGILYEEPTLPRSSDRYIRVWAYQGFREGSIEALFDDGSTTTIRPVDRWKREWEASRESNPLSRWARGIL